MLMSIVMFFTWQATGDSKYQVPFTKSVEATYINSDLKNYIDSAETLARNKAPVAVAIAPAAYALAIRKQFTFSSSKVTLVPGTVTSYHYDERTKAAAITATFAF